MSSVTHPLQYFPKRIILCSGRNNGMVSIGGRNIISLLFANDIDALAEQKQELEALVESLDKTCTRYKMAIIAEKTKLMTNSAYDIRREITGKGQKPGKTLQAPWSSCSR